MADASRELKIVIGADTDEAKDKLGGFGDSLDRVKDIAAGVGLERLAEKFIEVGKSAAEFTIDTATKFEQWKMGFDTMLGSAEKSSKLLNEISDFAQKTPFELPGLVEGSKQLVAFGVSADDVVKRLGQLGDIAAGIGTDKLPLLVHAFGQVEAGQRLTGRELNEFVMSGVPLLQSLADHYNKVGSASITTSEHIVKGTKMSAEQMTSLQHNIEETKKRLDVLGKEQVKTGIATDRHDLAVMTATHNLEEYQAKLAGANKVVREVGQAHKLTAMDVKEMIEKNQVSAKDVETVLGEMTSSGGRFFDMMNKQSQTFGGVMSNIRDQFSRFALAIAGFDMKEGSSTFGQIMSGSIFDRIRVHANDLLNFLNSHQTQIVAFFNQMYVAAVETYNGLKTAVISVIQVIQEANQFYHQHKLAIDAVSMAIGVYLIPTLIRLGVQMAANAVIMTAQFIASLVKGAASLVMFTIESYAVVAATIVKTATLTASTVAVVAHTVAMGAAHVATTIWTGAQWLLNLALSANPIGAVIIVVAALAAGIMYAYTHSESFRNAINGLWGIMKSWLGFLETNVMPALKSMGGALGSLASAADAVGNALSKIHMPNISLPNLGQKAMGGFGSGLTLVGEKGPELVNLAPGSHVTPADQTAKMLGGVTVTINNPTVRSDNDITEIVNQIKRILGRENELALLAAI